MRDSGTFHYPLSVVHDLCFLGMTFNECLTWVPHLKQLRHECQRLPDLLLHLPYTNWGADKTTLLRLYLVLLRSKFRSKRGYFVLNGAHVYCTAFPHALRILDPVLNKGLRLSTGAFHSSLTTSLHVRSDVLLLNLHKE